MYQTHELTIPLLSNGKILLSFPLPLMTQGAHFIVKCVHVLNFHLYQHESSQNLLTDKWDKIMQLITGFCLFVCFHQGQMLW